MSKEKIVFIDELGDYLKTRGEVGKIVLCHGVFDLLHIGHIRYFEWARRRGDFLAVSVTPDRFVNKGPFRPFFNEQLRLETLSALECIDLLILNNKPTAVNVIKKLKPAYYVKGPDYKDRDKDVTGGIVEEENAVRSVGGELLFSDDITFSSTELINKAFPVFPEEVALYLEQFKEKYTCDSLISLIEGARRLRVLVVGETIIDEYVYCKCIGKSNKEPVLAVRETGREKFAGGILALANHMYDFVDEVRVMTMLGEKRDNEAFVRRSLEPGIELDFFRRKGASTIKKRRYVEDYFFSKMFEVYDMEDSELAEDEEAELLEKLQTSLENVDLVVVVDYGHHMLTRKARELLMEKSPYLAINVQSNAGNFGFHTVSKYQSADLAVMATHEICLEERLKFAKMEEMMKGVLKKVKISDYLIVTRGKAGAIGYSEDEGFLSTPALALNVKDRMGAGDAFLSIASLLAVQRAPLALTSFVGNLAAAQAVATVGHRDHIRKADFIKSVYSLLR